MGWNACSSCFDDGSMSRSHLLVPGVRSSNIHVVDTATDPYAPRLSKVIEGAEIKSRTNLSAPHTVHCPGSEIIISMLGDARGEAPGGCLHLNGDFEIVGRWENSMGDIPFGYDFWYQPRHNVMASSEWAAPNTFMPGFDLEEVGHLKYGRRIHLWDFEKREPRQTFYLGEDGLIPLEVRFHHDPDSTHGFCGAALSANIIHWWKDTDGEWKWEKIIDVDNEPHPEWPIPVPGVISVILLSMDDRFLYLCNWLHGDVRQYDITDPHNPVLTGQVWMGGSLGPGSRSQRGQGHRRTTDDPAQPRWKKVVCVDKLVQHLGQPVLPGNSHQWRLHADGQLRSGKRRDGDRPGFRRRFRQRAPWTQPLSRNPLPRW